MTASTLLLPRRAPLLAFIGPFLTWPTACYRLSPSVFSHHPSEVQSKTTTASLFGYSVHIVSPAALRHLFFFLEFAQSTKAFVFGTRNRGRSSISNEKLQKHPILLLSPI